MKDNADDIWRFKGVLWTREDGRRRVEKRVVLQGLYGHFEHEVADWMPGKERQSQMVFIGAIEEELRGKLEGLLEVCKCPPEPAKAFATTGGAGAGVQKGASFAAWAAKHGAKEPAAP
ncbi:unnamed protein product [Chrysoparadoxa australica]